MAFRTFMHPRQKVWGGHGPPGPPVEPPLVVAFQICYFVSDAAVQILHVVERDHWVATSYHDGEVRLYDSASSGSLTPSLEKQMVEIYCVVLENGMLTVTVGFPFSSK